jgi:predicted amidophosphoribosyltransferase
MQFQIECNRLLKNYQTCLTCQEPFEMREARVIVCNEQGDSYGDICPHCIAMGFNWIGNQLQHLSHRLSQ